MKKLVTFFVIAVIALSFTLCLCGCEDTSRKIVVGASPTPHAEILEVVADKLSQEGWTLEIRRFDDYITPNTALSDGSIDANYFQHSPYLENFNADYNTQLVAAAKIHYEPFGVYGKNVTQAQYDADSFKTSGRTILVPNDGTNLTRALFVLQDEGFLTLRSGVTASDVLTVQDIENANGNEIRPVEAVTVATQLNEESDGTIAVINGNYALQFGFDVNKALAVESASGDAAQLYANIIAVRSGEENSEKTKALVAALLSQEVIDFINETYNGAVLAAFSL